jgi:hypothetical protein
MTDRVLLENDIAIISALVELAHAIGYGTKVRDEMLRELRERVLAAHHALAAPELLRK